MKTPTREEITNTIAKHEARRARGLNGPYTAYELTLCGWNAEGNATAIRTSRRAMNTAIANARAAIARRKAANR